MKSGELAQETVVSIRSANIAMGGCDCAIESRARARARTISRETETEIDEAHGSTLGPQHGHVDILRSENSTERPIPRS